MNTIHRYPSISSLMSDPPPSPTLLPTSCKSFHPNFSMRRSSSVARQYMSLPAGIASLHQANWNPHGDNPFNHQNVIPMPTFLGTGETFWTNMRSAAPSAPYSYVPLNYDVRRKNATRESTTTLKAWLFKHIKNPYPTKGEKIMLAIITKMTLTQVSTWFANARRRLKKENKMQWSPRQRPDDDDDDDDNKICGNDVDNDDVIDADDVDYSQRGEGHNFVHRSDTESLGREDSKRNKKYSLLSSSDGARPRRRNDEPSDDEGDDDGDDDDNDRDDDDVDVEDDCDFSTFYQASNESEISSSHPEDCINSHAYRNLYHPFRPHYHKIKSEPKPSRKSEIPNGVAVIKTPEIKNSETKAKPKFWSIVETALSQETKSKANFPEICQGNPNSHLDCSEPNSESIIKYRKFYEPGFP